LFKKILPSKKASENPVLRRKNNPRQPPTLGIYSFHVDNNSKTIIISEKGTPIFLETKKEKHWTCFCNIFGN